MTNQGFSEEEKDRVIKINDKVYATREPVIPKGFAYKEGKVSEGYVIVDNGTNTNTQGNEFVWVPVPKGTFGTKSTAFIEPYKTATYTEEEVEYNAMVASVEKYGGFYMARYEASKNTTTNKAQSVANVKPWILIPWGDTFSQVGSTGAVAKAREVYPVSSANLGSAVSTLPYGCQWDAAVKYIAGTKVQGFTENDGYKYLNIETDSEDFGHYSSDDLIETGYNPAYKLNNIYDMAGNVAEWTMEASIDNTYRPHRGGNYRTDVYPISDYTADDTPENGVAYVGFRIALYIK